MHIVIIGGSIAAVKCAEELRKQESTCEITLLSEEPTHPYSRIFLPKYITGEKTVDDILLKPASWYEEQNITLRLDARATAIDRDTRVVTASANGEDVSFSYDALVLATGARPRILPFPSPTSGVFALRTRKDADDILAYRERENAKNALVIGGGLLGLELAYSLQTLGINTTVVEVAERLMPRQLDEGASAMIQAHLTEKGVTMLTGKMVTEIAGDEKPTEGVLKTDERISCDMAFQQVGVVSETTLAKDAGLTCNRGIVIDTACRTNDERIYAIGDCAEYDGMVYGVVPPALEQATATARAITGETAPYGGSIPKTWLKVAGLAVVSLGDTALAGETVRSETYTRDEENIYRRVFLDDGVLKGAILIGKANANAYAKLLDTRVPSEDLHALLRA